MTLAQVYAAIAFVFAIIATLTGLLTSVALLMPAHAARAERALDETPKRCFGLGIAILGVTIIGLIGFNLPVFKLFSSLLLLGISGLITLGCAGMARLMGQRIGEMSGARSSLGCLVRGSLAYSIGVLFPLVGWLLLLPISVLCAAGAGLSAVWPKVASQRLLKGLEGQGAV
jgi:hypothetical protein